MTSLGNRFRLDYMAGPAKLATLHAVLVFPDRQKESEYYRAG